MVCRKCRQRKSPADFYDGKYTCKTCLATYFKWYYQTHRKRSVVQDFGDEPRAEDGSGYPREIPPPTAVYLTSEAIHHSRCERPLRVIGYLPSGEELHLRCNPCSESVFLPAVAVERLERR